MIEGPNKTPRRRTQLRYSFAAAPDQGVVIVRVSGEIDSASTPRLSAVLHRELDTARCRLLVVDLREVDFLSAQGIAVLTIARQHAEAYHIGFALIAAGAVRRLLQPLETIEKCIDIDYP